MASIQYDTNDRTIILDNKRVRKLQELMSTSSESIFCNFRPTEEAMKLFCLVAMEHDTENESGNLEQRLLTAKLESDNLLFNSRPPGRSSQAMLLWL